MRAMDSTKFMAPLGTISSLLSSWSKEALKDILSDTLLIWAFQVCADSGRRGDKLK